MKVKVLLCILFIINLSRVNAQCPLTIDSLFASPSTICSGQSSSLSGWATGTPPYTYSWINTTTSTPLGTSQTINSGILTTTSTFQVTVTDANCSKTSINLTVTVSALGTTSTISGSTAVCKHANSSTPYSVPAVTNATYYTWTITPSAAFTGIAGNGGKSILVNWNNAYAGNNATITVTPSNNVGCMGSSVSKFINLLPCRLGLTSDDIEELQVDLFPNPSYDQAALIVKGNESQKAMVQITDMEGKNVFQYDEVSSYEELNIGKELAPGVYMIKVISNESMKILKFVKTK
jgi:hypothetical protein